MALQALDDLAPQRRETRRVDPLGEILRQQRAVVVAKVAAEPSEPPRKAAGLDCKRQDEEQLAAAVAAGDDGGPGAAKAADVPLPGGEPVEALEHGAVGDLLERTPIRLDHSDAFVHGKTDIFGCSDEGACAFDQRLLVGLGRLENRLRRLPHEGLGHGRKIARGTRPNC